MLKLTGCFGFECLAGNLAIYSLKLETFWDEETFPKQYPHWRPNAQWSKTIGLVHHNSTVLFSEGEPISDGLKEFIETGEGEGLEKEVGEKLNTSLDTILLPMISQGVGSSEASIFVDGNHTKVSMVTKIVPSPDWFVGVDTLDLCPNGHFINTLQIKLDPLDGGTDNGFTFTSPNWPTDPQGAVFKITPIYPSHPAGSFYYPQYQDFPTLATYTFKKVKEYTLNDKSKNEIQGFITTQKESVYPTGNEDEKTEGSKYEYLVQSEVKDNNEIIDFIPIQETTTDSGLDISLETNEIPQPELNNLPTLPPISSIRSKYLNRKKQFRSGYHASVSPTDFLKKKYKSQHLNQAQDKVYNSKMSKQEILQKILNGYTSNDSVNMKQRRHRKKKFRRHNYTRPCRVSQWAEWSSCSKSCGIGEAVRTRIVEQHPKNGGRPCPKLRDHKWCGSARNCNNGYFNW